jgi:hypothetical protein
MSAGRTNWTSCSSTTWVNRSSGRAGLMVTTSFPLSRVHGALPGGDRPAPGSLPAGHGEPMAPDAAVATEFGDMSRARAGT